MSANERERDIEKHLITCAAARGGSVRKVKWLGRRGAPDRFVLLPGQHFFVELKRPGGKAEAHQAREHERLKAAGCQVFVLDTKPLINQLFAMIPLKGALGA